VADNFKTDNALLQEWKNELARKRRRASSEKQEREFAALNNDME